MLQLAVAQRAQYFNALGEAPLSLGRVHYLDVLTGDSKSVYADPNGAVELPNPVLLDIGGYVPVSGVFYAEGNYTIRVERCINPEQPVNLRVYEEEYVVPDVPGSVVSDVGAAATVFINAVESIPNLTPGEFTYVYCQQYYNSADRDAGGGWFKWFASSTATPDLGSVFSTTGSPAIGRYVRIYPNARVKTAYYGVVPAKGASMTSRIQSAATYALANRMTLEFSAGVIETSGDISITAGDVEFEDGFKLQRFEALVGTTLTVNAKSIEVKSQAEFITVSGLPGGPTDIVLNTSTPMVMRPEWWGADPLGSSDSWSAFFRACTSANTSGGSSVKISGIYRLTAAGAFIPPDLECPHLIFGDGAKLITTFPILKLSTIDAPVNASQLIETPNDNSVYLGSLTGYVEANWVFPFTMTADFFYWRCRDLQNGNQNQLRINWSNKFQAWAINGAMDEPGIAYKNLHSFSGGSYMQLAGTTFDVADFGYIETFTDCLDTAWAAPRVYNGAKLNMLWWGIGSSTPPAFVTNCVRKSIAAGLGFNDDYCVVGTVDFNGLALSSNSIGSIACSGGSVNLINGTVNSSETLATLSSPNELTVAINASINVASGNRVVYKGMASSNAAATSIAATYLTITECEIASSQDLSITSTSGIKVKDSTFISTTKIFVQGCPGGSITNNNFTTPLRLVEAYRHIEFRNCSQMRITGNTFSANGSIGSTIPSGNWCYIWITGAGSSSIVRGFNMSGNLMVDQSNIQAAVISYPYSWARDLVWITQADLAIDGHIADVYDNAGNIYAAPDANGNLPNAQIIPGTRALLPRIYVGSGAMATYYFILPKSIAPQTDPNFAYVRPVRFTAGPNTTASGAAWIPPVVQPPTTLTPPFTSRVLNNNTYQVNAEIWVSTGLGSQLYT
jgi:hypothetical protein